MRDASAPQVPFVTGLEREHGLHAHARRPSDLRLTALQQTCPVLKCGDFSVGIVYDAQVLEVRTSAGTQPDCTRAAHMCVKNMTFLRPWPPLATNWHLAGLPKQASMGLHRLLQMKMA